MQTHIAGATVVAENVCRKGTVVIEDDRIVDVVYNSPSSSENRPLPSGEKDGIVYVDAEGCYVMPGVIDTHVHFREPGMEHKATIASETAAAAAGGVTSFFDMPNTVPQTLTIESLEDKWRRAEESSIVNYSFFPGASKDNIDLLRRILTDSSDECRHIRERIPGIKLFMGSSTGGMLLDRESDLERLFAIETEKPIVAHCEETSLINRNLAEIELQHGKDPDVRFHPMVRNSRSCLVSTKRAIGLAQQYGRRLHIAHLSTSEETELFLPNPNLDRRITAEAAIGHLLFADDDYQTLGTRIKVNPAIKTVADRSALRHALATKVVTTVATDHAPHLLSEKAGGCRSAASGMPMIQFLLPSMLELSDSGLIGIGRVCELLSESPARLFGIPDRGKIAKGMKADLVVVRPHSPWRVGKENILSKCGWSPLEGHEFSWRVERTYCNGRLVYQLEDNKSGNMLGKIDRSIRGRQIVFASERLVTVNK